MKYRITDNEMKVLGEINKAGGSAYLKLIHDSLQKQLSTGSLYNVLSRLESGGYLKSEMQKKGAKGLGRRTIRVYSMQPNGAALLS